MKKGDIVLVPFPFTDLSNTKNRPALVLAYDQRDVILAFISTQVHLASSNDLLLRPNATNGLKKESLLRLSKLITLDARLILGKIGALTAAELAQADSSLARILGLRIE